ncbi:unnamed protein product [Thlaspi arvense]|uniref:NYN domain-containing protein n=1 Tax=Thlaspi arvense TaxID=13288 RepID=A0AAU9SZ08_THLAR|nr:unnamed protein product [Thlaspi arvense]
MFMHGTDLRIGALKFTKDSKTCVFWDVVDYPIAKGVDPASIRGSIKEAIHEKQEGGDGEVTVYAYGDKSTTVSEREFADAGFDQFELVTEGGKRERFWSIFADISLWRMEVPAPANIIVLAKVIEDTMLPYRLVALLTCWDYGVRISEVKPKWRFPGGSAASFLTSIIDGTEPDNTPAADALAAYTLAANTSSDSEELKRLQRKRQQRKRQRERKRKLKQEQESS